MATYKAIKCRNCHRHSMSTAKIPHCQYCRDKHVEVMMTEDKHWKVISEYVRRANGVGHYEEDVSNKSKMQ